MDERHDTLVEQHPRSAEQSLNDHQSESPEGCPDEPTPPIGRQHRNDQTNREQASRRAE
jgi:hypothetical protein